MANADWFISAEMWEPLKIYVFIHPIEYSYIATETAAPFNLY